VTLLLNIDVPDVETGVRFYTQAFGLTSAAGSARISSSCWDGRQRSYLLTKEAGTIGAGGDKRRYSRHWTPVHPTSS